MNPLLLESATQLAARIRCGEVSSRETVEAHIARIQEVNPRINAMVEDRFTLARAEAEAADERVKQGGELPVFFGVPCTIKESFELTGMPNSSGLVSRRNVRSRKDATCVTRFRQAGAIPLGVTNISELCMWMESSNRVYGRTNNPYDVRCIVGGSSGGEGAIVGAGASPFGLAADIGGSIRMPAFFNGVFGHKPTGGLVPGTGQYPIAEKQALRYLTTGPICRRAEDLWPLLQIMAGPDGIDTGCEPRTLGDPQKVEIGNLRVFDVEGNGRISVDKQLLAGQKSAAQALSARGARIQTIAFEGLRQSLEIWAAMLDGAGGTPFSVLLGDGEPTKLGRHFLLWLMRRSPHTFPALGLVALEAVAKRLPSQAQKFIARGRELADELRTTIGDGVMLYPSYPTLAPRHYRPILMPFHWVYTAIFNVLEFPVTQVPLGLSQEGLPLGVQVVGAPGNDHITVAVALELEKIFGGWAPPPN